MGERCNRKGLHVAFHSGHVRRFLLILSKHATGFRHGSECPYRKLATADAEYTETISKFNTPRAYAAFVRALEHCLTDRAPLEKLDDKWFDEYPLRDMAEKVPIIFLAQLMQKYGADQVIKAGFVEKWLAKQYWGDTPAEREKNFVEYMYKQNRISELIDKIKANSKGREALIKAGLIPNGDSRRVELFPGIHVEPVNLESFNSEAVPRHLEQSPEEQRLRHRHREAMVLNDGTRPLGRSDIIQREHDTSQP